jgi:DNA recombination protein RmuC
MDWTNLATLIVAVLAALGVLALLLRRGSNSLAHFDRLADQLERQDRGLRDELSRAKAEQANHAKGLREEVAATLHRMAQTLEQALSKLQADNALKLDQMRQTVDEKLQGTLEKRLGESFKLVSERLEQVHKGLGEMQNLASGVGDLKKVLTNVKTRGTWGEVQLGALLEQMLSPEQFIANAAPREGSGERVEYVVRLPGGEGELWLPIDAKFPQEDYERLVDAAERADADGVEIASRALEQRVRAFAKDVRDKYINPPRTTDFALLFLPTEGLYAELLRRPGLADNLQRDFNVTLCGPTTLGAILTSFRMGFKTLAIQQRSSEVWSILGAVKAEFGKYGDMLDKVNQKLREASNTIDQVNVRKRAIDRKLRDVAELPTAQARSLLELPAPEGREDEKDDLLT